ncbi:MAG: PEP_CTERM-anchored TLD domain-containing protein [Pseudomonadota bacterium]
MFVKKLIVAALLTLSMGAQAGVVVGGSTLINSAGQTQLEAWLGQGELTLTNIFTKSNGKSGYDFHAAADGKGATFSLMSASEDGGTTWKTIGGYKPVSWTSQYDYHYASPLEWSAFVFNLSDGVKKNEINQYQTYNGAYYGPTFGGGHDIFVDGNLGYGYSYGWSYGAATGQSLVDGSYYDGLDMLIRDLEVFTIGAYVAPEAVPEPATFMLFGLGLFGLAAARRKKAAKGL